MGSLVKDINPRCVTRKIYVPNATFDTLLEVTREQLQLYFLKAEAMGIKPEPVYVIFCVGIHDIAPTADLTKAVANLNALVQKQAGAREKLGSCVSNVTFTSAYPPSMGKLGATDLTFHAQQFVNVIFRFYNKWIGILDCHNRSGFVRMCRPFVSGGGKYTLKINQLAEDGIMPNAATVTAVTRGIDGNVEKIRADWYTLNEHKSNPNESVLNLMAGNWDAVLKAEVVYLDASAGVDLSKRVVGVPFYRIMPEDRKKPIETRKKRVLLSHTPMTISAKVNTQNMQKKLPAQDANKTPCTAQHFKPICGAPAENDVRLYKEFNVTSLRTYKLCERLTTLAPQHLSSDARKLLLAFKSEEDALNLLRIKADRKQLLDFKNALKVLEESTPAPITVQKVDYKDPFASTHSQATYDPNDPYAVLPDDYQKKPGKIFKQSHQIPTPVRRALISDPPLPAQSGRPKAVPINSRMRAPGSMVTMARQSAFARNAPGQSTLGQPLMRRPHSADGYGIHEGMGYVAEMPRRPLLRNPDLGSHLSESARPSYDARDYGIPRPRQALLRARAPLDCPPHNRVMHVDRNLRPLRPTRPLLPEPMHPRMVPVRRRVPEDLAYRHPCATGYRRMPY